MNMNKSKVLVACVAILLVFAMCVAVDGAKENPETGVGIYHGTV